MLGSALLELVGNEIVRGGRIRLDLPRLENLRNLDPKKHLLGPLIGGGINLGNTVRLKISGTQIWLQNLFFGMLHLLFLKPFLFIFFLINKRIDSDELGQNFISLPLLVMA